MKLRNGLVAKVFPINIADNGVEFHISIKLNLMITGVHCRTFFTKPYKDTDKPHFERIMNYLAISFQKVNR